jgi:hypothetical protein
MKVVAHTESGARAESTYRRRTGHGRADAYRRVGALERASPQDVHRAVRWAVRAYARDPSARNAFEVELAIAALRRQRMRSR